nr:MAG TPA: hypothetical protein [Caudoviricetes sp.]
MGLFSFLRYKKSGSRSEPLRVHALHLQVILGLIIVYLVCLNL